MTRSNQSDLINQIETILEKEYNALINGELEALVKLLEQKKSLIETLSATPLRAEGNIKTLQTKAIRNQAMLESATRGIKTVANRLSTLQKVRRSLDTYDAHGQRQTIQGTTKATLEKRA